MNSKSLTVRRWGRRFFLAAGLAATLTAVYAFRMLSERPGQDAMRFVPASALMTASIDLIPSANQVSAFKGIDDALARNEMADILTLGPLSMLGDHPALAELVPLVRRSATITMLPGEKPEDTVVVVMVPLSDGAAASALVAKHGKPEFWRGTRFFRWKGVEPALMVMGDVLVITDKPTAFHAVNAVAKGEARAITSVAEFQAVRSKAISDANIVAFMSPKLLEKGVEMGLDKMSKDWMAVSGAIRDGGIQIGYSGRMDTKGSPMIARLSEITDVRSDLMEILPTGAYGMVAMSQPGAYMEMVESVMKEQPEGDKHIAEMQEGLKKEMDLDLKGEVIPAMKGNAVVALYPRSGEVAGADLLILMDDFGNSDPAALARKLQASIDKKVQEGESAGDKTWNMPVANVPGAFRFTGEAQKSIDDMMPKDGDMPIHRGKLAEGKTVAWGFVGKSVIFSTSTELLQRAMTTYASKTQGLAADALLGCPGKELLGNSQSAAIFSLSRIAEGVRNTMDFGKMKEEEQKTTQNVLAMFDGLKAPLTVAGKLAATGDSTASTFIPMSYEKMIDFFASMTKKSDGPR